MNMKIAELMRVSPPSRDLHWLQKALQSAVELELSTLPPYLCGQWCLRDQNSPAAQLITGIVFDEMSHFGLACNLLTATGKKPDILGGYDAIVYPGPLPGGVRPKPDPTFFPVDPHFHVTLGFPDFHAFAKMAMQIEYPEDPVLRPAFAALKAETFPSIGEFYDAVLAAFKANDGKFVYQTTHQITNDSPVVILIDGLPAATTAITMIQTQGEGSSKFPFVDPGMTQLAHFYTFGELFFGKKYVFNAAAKTGDWTGDPVPIPPVFPMTPVPLGGYGHGAPPEVATCDADFTKMLTKLDNAWATGDGSALDDAISAMLQLKKDAIALLSKQHRRPEGGIFGPQFRKN